jgi:uncharacterized protein
VTTATDPERIAVAFARLLRAAELEVPVGSVTTFVDALTHTGLDDRDDVYWSGRATLLHRPEDVDVYDRAFAVFWDRRTGTDDGTAEAELEYTLAFDDGEDHADDEGDDGTGDVIAVRYSRAEVLGDRDFARCSEEELSEIHGLMERLRLGGARRKARRLRPSKRTRGRPDLGRTVRLALSSGGEPFRRAFVEPDERPRRVVLLLDVSGSMEPYARGLLRFAHVAVAARARVEAFTFGTRLTRVTRELSSHDPDAGLLSASEAVKDWSGGTRIGEALRSFNDEWGVRGMARGAVVVILSDGWDRGEPELLAEEMGRLSRVAHNIVWVNPLKYTDGYEPLARGMAAALPYVDEFVEGHSLNALERLAELIAT